MVTYISITFFNSNIELHLKVKGYVSEILEVISEKGANIKTITIGDVSINIKYVGLFAVSDVASYLESINHYLGYLEDYHQINHKEDKNDK